MGGSDVVAPDGRVLQNRVVRLTPLGDVDELFTALDDCHMHRVKIQTDAINLRSQGAIARLGAVREGVLREHVVRADGTWRDTVVFSILASEWPAVRARLEHRLEGV